MSRKALAYHDRGWTNSDVTLRWCPTRQAPCADLQGLRRRGGQPPTRHAPTCGQGLCKSYVDEVPEGPQHPSHHLGKAEATQAEFADFGA